MENKSNVGSHLIGGVKKVGVATFLKNQTVEKQKNDYKKDREPYLLPCGNDSIHCFLRVRRKNTFFCCTYKKIVWAKCRFAVFTDKYFWEER